MRSKYGWQRWMATAALVSALAAPGASASPVGGPGTSPAMKAYQARLAAEAAGDRRSPDARVAFESSTPGNAGVDLRSPDARLAFEPAPVATSPVVQVPSHGFQWSDAGIGALAMLGAISLCGGLFLLSGRRRERHLPRAIG